MRVYTITQHVADQVAALDATSARRRRWLRPLMLVLLTLLIVGVPALLIAGRTTLAIAAAGAGLIALLVLGVAAMAGPSEREAAIKRAGAAGEAILPQLLQPLPDSFTLLNGVPMPGGRADIDHVLVGPPGIWALEIKHHVGMVQCVGDAWGYTRLGPGGVPREGHIGNPSQQAQRAAAALERYLQRRGVEQPVRAAVVFTHPRVELTIERPTLPVLRAAEAADFITRQPRRLSPAECERAVQTLRQLKPLS